MITLRLGPPQKKLSPDEVLAAAERAQQLLGNQEFRALLEGAADDVVQEWSAAQTADAREAAWHKLEGLRALQVRLQVVIDRGKAVVMTRERTRKVEGGAKPQPKSPTS